MSDTIYSRPSIPFYTDLSNAPTGLVGTIGVRILRKTDGEEVTARTTAGIVEKPAGSGHYIATLLAPAVKTDYTVLWDDGVVSPSTTASDDLVVVATLPEPEPQPVGRPYNYATIRDVEAYLPGLVVSPSSRPSADDVLIALELTSNELDGVLGMLNYDTPVATGATASMQVVRAWATVGGAYRAAQAMPQGSDSKHAEAYCEEWSAILKGIEGGRRKLPDSRTSASKLPRHGSPAPSADPCADQPVFTRESADTQR